MVPNGVVFIYYFAHHHGTIEAWEDGLAEGRERLSGLLRSVVRATRADIQTPGSRVILHPGLVIDAGWMAPIELRVNGLFEDMIGDLRLDSIDFATTRVTLRASYAPVDGSIDGTHLLVETLVKRFVDSLESFSVDPDGHSTSVQ